MSCLASKPTIQKSILQCMVNSPVMSNEIQNINLITTTSIHTNSTPNHSNSQSSRNVSEQLNSSARVYSVAVNEIVKAYLAEVGSFNSLQTISLLFSQKLIKKTKMSFSQLVVSLIYINRYYRACTKLHFPLPGTSGANIPSLSHVVLLSVVLAERYVTDIPHRMSWWANLCAGNTTGRELCAWQRAYLATIGYGLYVHPERDYEVVQGQVRQLAVKLIREQQQQQSRTTSSHSRLSAIPNIIPSQGQQQQHYPLLNPHRHPNRPQPRRFVHSVYPSTTSNDLHPVMITNTYSNLQPTNTQNHPQVHYENVLNTPNTSLNSNGSTRTNGSTHEVSSIHHITQAQLTTSPLEEISSHVGTFVQSPSSMDDHYSVVDFSYNGQGEREEEDGEHRQPSLREEIKVSNGEEQKEQSSQIHQATESNLLYGRKRKHDSSDYFDYIENGNGLHPLKDYKKPCSREPTLYPQIQFQSSSTQSTTTLTNPNDDTMPSINFNYYLGSSTPFDYQPITPKCHHPTMETHEEEEKEETFHATLNSSSSNFTPTTIPIDDRTHINSYSTSLTKKEVEMEERTSSQHFTPTYSLTEDPSQMMENVSANTTSPSDEKSSIHRQRIIINTNHPTISIVVDHVEDNNTNTNNEMNSTMTNFNLIPVSPPLTPQR